MVNIVNFNVLQFTAIGSFNTLVTHRVTKTSPSNDTNIYKAQVEKVSLGANRCLFTAIRVNFYACIE